MWLCKREIYWSKRGSYNDLVTYADKQSIPGILLQLDFEKAFDTIEWISMWETLKKFNFSTNFINMIKICYRNIESTFKVVGGLNLPEE